MKTFRVGFVVFVLIFSATISAYPAFTLPAYVYDVNQLSAAQDEARSSNQPIVFLWADKNTDCNLASAAAVDVINNLRKLTVIVYVDQNNDWNKLPSIIKRALNSDEAGRYVPKTVISNPDIDEIIYILPYAKQEKRKNLINEAINSVYYY